MRVSVSPQFYTRKIRAPGLLILCLLDVRQDYQFSSEPTSGVGLDELELTSSSVSFISSPNKSRLHEKYLYYCRVTARQFSVVNKSSELYHFLVRPQRSEVLANIVPAPGYHGMSSCFILRTFSEILQKSPEI